MTPGLRTVSARHPAADLRSWNRHDERNPHQPAATSSPRRHARQSVCPRQSAPCRDGRQRGGRQRGGRQRGGRQRGGTGHGQNARSGRSRNGPGHQLRLSHRTAGRNAPLDRQVIAKHLSSAGTQPALRCHRVSRYQREDHRSGETRYRHEDYPSPVSRCHCDNDRSRENRGSCENHRSRRCHAGNPTMTRAWGGTLVQKQIPVLNPILVQEPRSDCPLSPGRLSSQARASGHLRHVNSGPIPLVRLPCPHPPAIKPRRCSFDTAR